MNSEEPPALGPIDQGPSDGRWETDPPETANPPVNVREYIRDATLEELRYRQRMDFISEMEDFFQWLVTYGNRLDTNAPEGHERSTATNYLKRLTRLFPIFWKQNGGYTLQFTKEMGDWYVSQLRDDAVVKRNGQPYSASSKRKQICALLNFYRFRWDQREGPSWEPFTLFDSDGEPRVADPIQLSERSLIREAALEYKTVKRYNNCTPEERDRIRAELAQRLGKPKDDVKKADWEEVNQCWKWPSIILSGLDTALRPIEVERAKMSWLKLSVPRIEVPKEDAAKNSETWEVPITERTARALRQWKRQRSALPKYDDSNRIWLTREGNPYSSGPLGRNLRRIMDEAGIDYSDRDISWYSFRHSLATYLAMTTDDIEEVRQQMRHKRLESTLGYIDPPEEKVRDNLNSIN